MDSFVLLSKLVSGVPVSVRNVNDGLRSGRGSSLGEHSGGDTISTAKAASEGSLGYGSSSRVDSLLEDGPGSLFRACRDRVSTWDDARVVSSFLVL